MANVLTRPGMSGFTSPDLTGPDVSFRAVAVLHVFEQSVRDVGAREQADDSERFKSGEATNRRICYQLRRFDLEFFQGFGVRDIHSMLQLICPKWISETADSDGLVRIFLVVSRCDLDEVSPLLFGSLKWIAVPAEANNTLLGRLESKKCAEPPVASDRTRGPLESDSS